MKLKLQTKSLLDWTINAGLLRLMIKKLKKKKWDLQLRYITSNNSFMKSTVSKKMVMIEKSVSINKIKQSDHNLMHVKFRKISLPFNSRLYLLRKKVLKSTMNKNQKILQNKMRKANFLNCRFQLLLNKSTRFLI